MTLASGLVFFLLYARMCNLYAPCSADGAAGRTTASIM